MYSLISSHSFLPIIKTYRYMKCVVAVSKGEELLSPKAIQEAQILKKNPRWRMACKTVVGYGMKDGQLTIQVNPRQWEQV